MRVYGLPVCSVLTQKTCVQFEFDLSPCTDLKFKNRITLLRVQNIAVNSNHLNT